MKPKVEGEFETSATSYLQHLLVLLLQTSWLFSLMQLAVLTLPGGECNPEQPTRT